MVINESKSGVKNTCPYICGIDAKDYTTIPSGLQIDTGETLNAGINDVVTALVITDVDSTNAFSDWDYMLIDDEIIKITTSQPNALGVELQSVVSRGHFGTTPVAHSAGATIYKFAQGDKKLSFWGDVKSINSTITAKVSTMSIDGAKLPVALELAQGDMIPARITKLQMSNINLAIMLLNRR